MSLKIKLVIGLIITIIIGVLYWSLFNEKQNKTSRYIQNIIGLDGTLEIYAGNKFSKKIFEN